MSIVLEKHSAVAGLKALVERAACVEAVLSGVCEGAAGEWTKDQIAGGVVVAPVFNGRPSALLKEGETVYIVMDGQIYETPFFSDALSEINEDVDLVGVLSFIQEGNYLDSDGVKNALNAQTEQGFTFFVSDVVALGGRGFQEKEWDYRQDTIRNLGLAGNVLITKHRVAYTQESLNVSIDWASKLQGVSGVSSFSLADPTKSVSFMFEGKQAGNFLVDGEPRGAIRAYRCYSGVTGGDNSLSETELLKKYPDLSSHTVLEFIQKDTTSYLVALPPESGNFLNKHSPIPVAIGESGLGDNDKAFVVDEGEFIVSRVRRDGAQYYEFITGFEENKNLNGVWGVSEKAADDFDIEGQLMFWIPQNKPFYLREAKTKKRKEEFASLPDWQKPDIKQVEALLEGSGETLRLRIPLKESLTGNRWAVTIIRAGLSLNDRYWSKELLQRSAHIFENAPVNFIEIVPGVSDHMSKSVREKIPAHPVANTAGWFENVSWSEEKQAIVGEMVLGENADAIKKLLLNAQGSGHRDFLGLSVDVLGRWKSDTIEGRDVIRVVDIFEADAWVDIVNNPAAGGKIEKALESTKTIVRSINMDKKLIEAGNAQQILSAILLATGFYSQSMVEAILNAIQPLLESKDFTLSEEIQKKIKEGIELPSLDEQIKALDDDGFKALRPELFKAPDERVVVKESAEFKVLEDKLNQEITKNAAMRLLSESELPKESKIRLLKSFSGLVLSEKEIKEKIDDHEQYVASLLEGVSTVKDTPSEEETTTVLNESVKKVKEILGRGDK